MARYRRQRVRSFRGVLIATGTVVATAIAGAGALYVTDNLPVDVPGDDAAEMPTRTPPPDPAWAPAANVMGALESSGGGPDHQALADQVATELSESVLGSDVSAHVVNLSTNDVAYSDRATDPQTPASILKLATGAAALTAVGHDHTFTTEVVLSGDATITLVGGGDPVLRTDGASWGTSLGQLAKKAAKALKAQDITTVTLNFDDSLFSGSVIDPDWESTYVAEGVVAPVSALEVDGGRVSPDSVIRDSDPALATAEDFAEMLVDQGVQVTGSPARKTVQGDVKAIAAAKSAPLSEIVEHIIAESDDDAAEALARHVALAADHEGSSAAAEEAIESALAALGVNLDGVNLLDGSGLSRGSAVTMKMIVQILALAAADDHPELRSLITGLPVAGLTGTLAERFGDEDNTPGAVRAKTGTLVEGGVSSLAGIAVGKDGTPYVFAFAANGINPDDALAARAALDDAASALAR